MRELVEEVVNEILFLSEGMACDLSIKTVGRDGYLICNDDSKKIAAVGMVRIQGDDGSKEKIVGAFSINIARYHWAEAEGFSEKQMIEQLNDEIFTLMGVDEVLDYLCEGQQEIS